MSSTSKYPSFRYGKQHPFAKQVHSYWVNSVGPTLMPSQKNVDNLQKILMSNYNIAIEGIPFEQRPANHDVLFGEINTAITYGVFCANGRNIFDFDNDLVELFKNTDVGDVPASAIRTPYDSLYVSFGPQAGLEIYEGSLIDGAYISLQRFDDKVIVNINVTTISSDENAVLKDTDFLLSPEKGYHLSFDINQDRPIDAVLTESLDEKAKEMKLPDDFIDTAAKAGQEEFGENIKITSSHEAGSKRRRQALYSGFPAFREAVNLIVNALFYLSAYPDENSLDWPSDAPTSLTGKADKGKTHKEKRRAESKLLPLGFTRVRFCRINKENKAASNTDSTVLQHWRRGHWRNQAHGEKLSLRKLIWVMPVLVNSNKDTGANDGHIYVVNSIDNNNQK